MFREIPPRTLFGRRSPVLLLLEFPKPLAVTSSLQWVTFLPGHEIPLQCFSPCFSPFQQDVLQAVSLPVGLSPDGFPLFSPLFRETSQITFVKAPG